MTVTTDEQATIDLLWGHRPAATRGPKPALTIDRIAGAAVAVADAEGIDAVSMQRVAESLSFTKMSLYRYVAGKSDLLAVMVEHAVGEPPDLSRVRSGWRARVERWAALLSASWDEHPWLPGATTGRRVMGPREIGWVEAGVAALEGTALTPAERFDVVVSISGNLRNTQSAGVAGTQPWHEGPHARLIGADTARFPALAGLLTARPRTPRQTRDFGLRCLLDGVAAQLAERS
jgi:AcrR family transcriptional regulator